MSFANNYLALRAKRLKDQQQKKEDPMPNLDSPFKLNTLALKSPSEMEDYIAPVGANVETEEERKWFEAGAFDDGYDFGDVTKTILGSGVDVVENVASGVLGMGETVLDSGMMLGGLAAKHFMNGTTEMLIQSDLANYKRLYGDRPKMVEEYEKKLRAKYAKYGDLVDEKTTEIVAEDLYDEEKIAKTIISNPFKALTTVDAEKDSVFGEKFDSLAQSGGQLLATAGLQAVGVPWWLTTGATSFGSESENALRQGASLEEAAFSGAVSAGAEILSEKISGGISFGGKTLDAGLTEALAKNISNKTVRTLAKLGIDAAGEGGEEILSGVMSAIGQQLSYREDEELFGKDGIFSTEDAFESFIGGAILGGGSSLFSSVKDGKQNKKPDTLKPDTEQKVVDKLYNDAIAEAEADGKKLTQKEKQKLYDSVLNDLDKGYISTDTIEEILGGEDYKAYKDTIDSEDSLIKELDELRNMKSGDMTDIQRDRLTELKGMNLTDTTKRNGLKTKLGESVFGLVKDTRLAESYNERTRRSQAFEADLSKYDEKQAAVIQRAIDSGILNNTNRTHDFVDMVSKISADKGVLFDFANNAKLKESGFAVDGATINGFVTKDGVTLNIDSAKSLNSVVGHEITHVLEGTELYAEMQKALFDYAKSKNDYQGRYDSLSALYKGVKGADVDAELTADLVGDYLFTDQDFIHNLSTKHRNVFKKIFDEIKYLYKMATAGSKEARELEKVKRAFDKAYAESGKGVEGTSYSLSDSDGKALTNEQSEYFKDSKMRDENGNLMVMYHGSQNAGFHIFDPSYSDDGTSLFFVDRNEVATTYSGTSETYEAKAFRSAEDANKFFADIGKSEYEVVEKDGEYTLLDDGDEVAKSNDLSEIYQEFCDWEGVGYGDANYKVYLNLTNPLEIDAKGRPWNKIDAEFSQEVYDKYNSLTAEEKEALTDLAEWEDFSLFNSEIQEARGDALASAYAKMGEDCNIYDLFSVAADSFSEDSMRENARKYLKTRDYAQRAKEQGYDGVIFKNVVDNGGYSSGDEGASTVAIAFSSEQVKSVANDKPTGDPDIRYSLTEYTAEEKKAHNDAVKNHFGKTYSWAETGYLLLDGTRLDLSGKHDGAPGGYRTVDHRDITEALGYDYGGGEYSDSLIQFMSEGNIRIIPEIDGINLSVKPTKAQEQALTDYISRVRGAVVLDIDDLNGYTVVSVEYPSGTRSTKILNDIREWFDNGVKPENAGNYSLTKNGETTNSRGWNIRGEDVKLENNIAPTQEATEETESVAPTVDNSVDEEVAPSMRELYGEGYAPIENAYTVEQEIEGIKKEMFSLYEQYNALKDEGKDAEAQPLFDKWLDLNEQAQALNEKAEAYKAEERGYFDSLTDADDPGEADEPYSLPRGNITLSDKTVSRVTKEIRKGLGLDAEDSAKMAEIVQKYAQNENMTEDELFEEIKNNFQYSEVVSSNEDILQQAKKYIRKTKLYVPDIVKGDFPEWNNFRKKHFGKFVLTNNNANLGIDQFYQELNELYPSLFPAEIGNAADQLKQIADVTDSEAETEYRYGAFDNDTIQEVVDTIVGNVRDYSQKEIQKQLDKDRRSFYKSIGADDIAPVAEEPISTYDTADKKQVPGQQTIFEDTQAEAPKKAEPPKVAEVLESTPKEPKKVNLWQKIRNLVFDKQSSIEDISLKAHNRELMGKADFMLRSESRAQRHIKNKLMPILEKVEATGERKTYETYVYHLHNIDRMSLESKELPNLQRLEAEMKILGLDKLNDNQLWAIAYEYITKKTTEERADTIKTVREYLASRDIKNKPVFGDEVTADASRDFVKKFEAAHKDAKEISEAITEYNAELRKMLVDGGVISQDTADLWAKMYPHYVPIRRVGKDGAAVTVPLDSRRTGVNAPIKRATGGNSDMESLLDVMGSRTEQVFRAIARNSFGLELMHAIDTVTDTKPTNIDEILDSFENEELLKKGENGANPTFTVFEDGKRVTFDITEELYDALKPTDGLLKADIPVMSFLTKLQRGLLTQYNPTFIVTNAVKDIQDVIVNSQHPGKTYANVPLAAKELFNSIVRRKDGKYITEYMENGGEDLTYFDSKKQVFKKDDSKVKKVLGFVPDKIAKMNDFVEKVPRLAEYIASRKNGASVEVAMLDAARVTTNFAAGGDLTKFANKNGFTFLNASVQGAAQQVRNIREAKANGLKGVMQLAAKFAVAGLPIMLFNALRWDDDEDYAELSDYVKDNYYIVAKYGDGKFVRIPKGRAVAVIQSGLEQMKNLITGNDEVDMSRFGQLLVENLAPNNPLDNNVLAPIIQTASNKTWYGEDLVPTRLQDLPNAEQFDETTDSISKWLGELTGQSPYKINYLLDQYSGGVGDMILPMLTPESDSGGVVAPFADKFTTDSVMKNQNISDFYTKVDELTKNANSMHATDDDILKSKYINSISSELGELYAQKREIQNNIVPEDKRYDDIRDLYKDKKIPDKVKDELVRDVQKQIVDLTKTGLSSYENIQYEGDGEYAIIGDRYYQWYTPKNGEAYWRKLDDDQVVKYNLTKNAGNAHYVTDGNVHYRLDEDGEWTKISDRQLERQNEVTKALGITPEEYWSKTDISFLPMSDGEYEYAFENPEKYTVAKAVGGYDAYKTYSSELFDIKADKDENGKSISGSRKEKVIEYINNLDADYGTKIILLKSEYNADDTYNRDIIDYLNSRDDISYEEMETILKELGFTVDSSGNISWD